MNKHISLSLLLRDGISKDSKRSVRALNFNSYFRNAFPFYRIWLFSLSSLIRVATLWLVSLPVFTFSDHLVNFKRNSFIDVPQPKKRATSLAFFTMVSKCFDLGHLG